MFSCALAAALIAGVQVARADMDGPTPAPTFGKPAIWSVDWTPAGSSKAPLAALDLSAASASAVVSQDPAPPARRKVVELSDAYYTRLKIHKIASLATLPLFVTQVVLGQKLYNGTAGIDVRNAHRAVAISIGSLFVVNSVTGVWNLVEAHKDPNGRSRRLIHGLLMLGADAGFVATGIMAPYHGVGGNRVNHRRMALISVGVATAGYLYMLLTR
jgi:hypothetical protein